MEPVTFHCSHCSELMAVSPEHLGTQVHCPHCRQVVQSPTGHFSRTQGQPGAERESIFTAQEEVSDDLFGGVPKPRVEMPAEAKPEFEGPTHISGPVNAEEAPSAAPLPVSLKPFRQASRSNLGPMVLIFLIPYAIVTTLFIAWLLYSQKKQTMNYERMYDPNPKDGGPRMQLKHDLPLPAQLKTPLNKAIQVGELEILPLGVHVNVVGDLVLTLKMHNTSRQVTFNPCPHSFVEFDNKVMRDWRPYTFLEGGPKPLYGATQQWFKGGGEPELDLGAGGMLKPREGKTLELTTVPHYNKEIPKLLQKSGSLLWRIHVRRGDFIQFGAKQYSTTAVIGVEFSTAAISKKS